MAVPKSCSTEMHLLNSRQNCTKFYERPTQMQICTTAVSLAESARAGCVPQVALRLLPRDRDILIQLPKVSSQHLFEALQHTCKAKEKLNI